MAEPRKAALDTTAEREERVVPVLAAFQKWRETGSDFDLITATNALKVALIWAQRDAAMRQSDLEHDWFQKTFIARRKSESQPEKECSR